jgi:membrane associated rhomboid family serine protease
MYSEQQFRPRGFRILPPVVKNLLIINGLFFLATIALSNSIDLADILGLHYFAAEKFKPFQIITYMFMHGSFTHILFNMFALWMFGYVLENVWGPKRFLVYFLVTGIGASLIHYLIYYFVEARPVLTAVDQFLDGPTMDGLRDFLDNDKVFRIVSYEVQNHFEAFRNQYNNLILSNPDQALQMGIDFIEQYRVDFLNAPVVIGASGAVFGILLAFGMLFPNSLIYIYFAIPIKAKYFVIFYGLVELYLGFSDGSSNVAHFAHLGGMIFGFFLIQYWKKRGRH